MVKIKTNVRYRLLNLCTGTYLGISTYDNSSIVGEDYSDKTAQQWTFENAEGTEYFIKSANSEARYLALPHNEVTEGKQPKANTKPFVWNVTDVSGMSPVALIRPAGAQELYLDIWEANPTPGTKSIVWHRTGHSQVWILEEVRN